MNIFTEEFLEEIGFELVYRKPSKYNKEEIYGKAIDKRTGGMTEITWNERGHYCTYFEEELPKNTSMAIKKDGGTRYAFNGYVFTQDDVRKLLSLTW